MASTNIDKNHTNTDTKKEAKPAPQHGDAETSTPKGKGKARIFTYVGGGEDSPRKINFMGLQEFVRGKPTEVTNEQILAKLGGGGHPTFIDGEVDQEELSKYDEESKQEAEEQRKKDAAKNAAYMKNHKTE